VVLLGVDVLTLSFSLFQMVHVDPAVLLPGADGVLREVSFSDFGGTVLFTEYSVCPKIKTHLRFKFVPIKYTYKLSHQYCSTTAATGSPACGTKEVKKKLVQIKKIKLPTATIILF
jgi:hypothetical protein